MFATTDPSCAKKIRLLAIATEIIPTLPPTLFNILPFPCELGGMLRMLNRELNGLELCESTYPFYMYFHHAYEVTNNQALNPLLDYFKPTKKCLRKAWCAFSHVRFHFADYLPTVILEHNGFDTLDEVDSVIENAFIHRQNEDGLERLQDVRGYINDVKSTCDYLLDTFPLGYHRTPYLYLRRSLCEPLLFYVDFALREDAINRFRELFYALKYKQKFRDLLWTKVREPKIRAKYHPDNLANLLAQHGDLDIDELDTLMEKW
jgi:hypothetical protein